MFIQTAVFKSLIPEEGKDITSALDTQKAAQKELVQSSFDGSDYRDAKAKQVLGMYQDFLTENVDPKSPSPREIESKTKVEADFEVDRRLSSQTRKGIALLQKSLEHRDIVEADTMADKLCAITISNPLFDGVRSKSRTQPRKKGRDIVSQVSKVNNYWASLVHRSDPHRLVTKQQLAQSRKADELRVRKAVDITQLPSLTSSPPSTNRRRHSFSATVSRARRFTLPVRNMRGQALPKLGGRRMSMAPGTHSGLGQTFPAPPMNMIVEERASI